MSFQLPCIDLVRLQRGSRNKASRKYSLFSHIRSRKCQKLDNWRGDIFLCGEMQCSSCLVQTLLWIILIPHKKEHDIMSAICFLLLQTYWMFTCLVQSYCGWSQTGSEPFICLRGLEMFGGFFIKYSKWIGYLPLLLIQKQAMLAKSYPSTQETSIF